MKRILNAEGYTVFRVAGSKPLDLIAFRGGEVALAECKYRGARREDLEKLYFYAETLKVPILLFILNNGRIVRRRIELN